MSAWPDSELAQPSGLYYAGDGKLYFADSESSTIRLADFENDLVTVVSGTTANNLFDFGDIDGELGVNRLQHALGIEGGPEGELYIADTYNSRIKVIRAGETSTHTLFGRSGAGGYRDGAAGSAEFDEPGGISYAAASCTWPIPTITSSGRSTWTPAPSRRSNSATPRSSRSTAPR